MFFPFTQSQPGALIPPAGVPGVAPFATQILTNHEFRRPQTRRTVTKFIVVRKPLRFDVGCHIITSNV
jgi:hypothetical protein